MPEVWPFWPFRSCCETDASAPIHEGEIMEGSQLPVISALASHAQMKSSLGSGPRGTEEDIVVEMDSGSDSELVTAMHTLCTLLQRGPLSFKQQTNLRRAIALLDRLIVRGETDVDNLANEKQDINKCDYVDEATKAFLIDTFMENVESQKEKKTFKQLAKKVQMAGRLVGLGNVLNEENPLAGSSAALLSELGHIDSLQHFDIFKVDDASANGVLHDVALKVFMERGLRKTFNLNWTKFQAFLREIEGKYNPADVAPYHNALHAADVVQGVHMMIKAQRSDFFDDIEVFSAMLASIGHDAAHPGVTNAFCVAMHHEVALVYNDVSVNEMMHASVLYRTLAQAGCEVLENLEKAQEKIIRKTVIAVILATDMVHHFAHVKKLQSMLVDQGHNLRSWESSLPALEMVVHAADISNTTRPYEVADRWVDRVLQEFFAQGDKERRLGIPVSPLCDARKISKASSQPGFIDFIVVPLFNEVNAYCDVAEQLKNMESGKAKWSQQAKVYRQTVVGPTVTASTGGTG